MQLLPIESDQHIELVSGWLSEKRNYQWLDFGNGVQKLSPMSLKIMVQKDAHDLRIFTSDDGTPIGVVGLSNIDRRFKTATLWVVLGERKLSFKGYPYRACAAMLSVGFDEHGLNVINAWAVETNHASVRIIRRLNFKRVGVQRKCHYIDGKAHDRLLFDLLAVEHKEIKDD